MKLLIIFIFILIPQLHAKADSNSNDISIKYSSHTARLGEDIVIEVRLSGPYIEAEARLLESENFTVTFAGSGLTQSFTSGKGYRSERTIQYNIKPKSVGSFVGPTVQIYKSGRLIIEKDGEELQIVKASQGLKGLSFSSILSDQKVWLGEQIVLINKLTAPSLIRELREISDQTHHIWSQPFPNSSRHNRSLSHSWKKALFPLRTGEITIPTQRVETVYQKERGKLNPSIRNGFSNWFFDDFFTTQLLEKALLESEANDITVMPLPDIPKEMKRFQVTNFPIVGELELKFEPKGKLHSSYEIGSKIFFTFTIRTSGYISSLKLPAVVEDKDRFLENWSEIASKNFIQDDRLWTEKEYSLELTALKPGRYNIPPVAITFFHTPSKSHQVLRSAGYELLIDGKLDFNQVTPPTEPSIDMHASNEADGEFSLPPFPPPPPLYQRASFYLILIPLLLVIFFGMYLIFPHIRSRQRITQLATKLNHIETLSQITAQQFLEKQIYGAYNLSGMHPDAILHYLKDESPRLDVDIEKLLYSPDYSADNKASADEFRIALLSVIKNLEKKETQRKV